MLFAVLVFISFVSTPAHDVVQNRVFSCSSSFSTNNTNVFKCYNGTDCIDIRHVCDGITDCLNGSDEDFCYDYNGRNHTHSKELVLHRSKRQFHCSPDQMQCVDGSCVADLSECKRGVSCVLPEYPKHGWYSVSDAASAGPGQVFDSVLLSVTCERGYGVVQSDGDVNSNGAQEVLCVNGKWLPSVLPQCVRFCELAPDASVQYTCRYPGSQVFRPCGRHVSHGTTVNPHCNGPVYYSHKSLLYMHCRHGSWDYVATCEPDCGRVTPEGVGLISNGKSAKRGELPWHVGVFSKISSPYSQICGGTLVSNSVVISAAHCFWSDAQKQVPASKFAVAAGKLYRAWKSAIDLDSQESDVQEILIPEKFQGTGSNLQADVAALILTTSFVYKTHVKPVCLSFAKDFDSLQLQPDQKGKVAGWGLTSANGAVSEELKVVELPYVEYSRCYNTVPHSFQQFLTLDKFCAGYTDGTAVCQGDSGGGLSFPTPDQHTQRYYLRGVVSAAPTLTEKRCNDQSYTTFTRVADYGEFIKDALQVRSFPVTEGCSPNQFLCDDGTCVAQESNCARMKISFSEKVPKLKMSDGNYMPAIGLGTYVGFDKYGGLKKFELRDVVLQAIDLGYRNFDTASIHNTEEETGLAIRTKIHQGVVSRNDIFFITKLWNTAHRLEEVMTAVKESLVHTGLSYIDLYLMHWPLGLNANNTHSDVDYMETWRGMELAQRAGLVKSLGVSNFNKEQLERVINESDIKPVALQIEVHPELIQTELIDFCKSQGIIVMGYSPLGTLIDRGGVSVGPKLTDPELVKMAKKYGKTVAQVVLRWSSPLKQQRLGNLLYREDVMVKGNVVPLPKTLTAKYLAQNIDIFDFKLTSAEIEEINKYNSNTRYTLPKLWQKHKYYPFEN